MAERQYPKAPSHLNIFGKRLWRELYPVLDERGRIDETDLTTFEALCFHYGIYREAWRAIYRPIDPDTGKRRKRTLEEYLAGKNSQTQPELSVMRESLKEFEKLMSEFGLSPLSRKKAGTQEEKQSESPMMEYVRKMNERLKRDTG
jgi:P27 family predicted phage terminase small subunit